MAIAEPNRASILLVEDDASLGRSLADLLRRKGYEVSVVSHGRAAMDFLAKQRVALVISDIFMPEGDGIELLTFLRRVTPQPLVMAMSGSGTLRVNSMLKMAGVLGAARTLAKPFQTAEFLGMVQELIGLPVATPPPAGPAGS
ncbi:MAG: response regulator [Oleiharenicola lentus]